ncbi:MAG TPA: hypothetical protein VFV39_03120, partial [Limnobacter sp.]|nr:hypothetical protein [Limnobacter sp.]
MKGAHAGLVLAGALLLAGCLGNTNIVQTTRPTSTNPNEVDPGGNSGNPGNPGNPNNPGNPEPPLFPTDPIVRSEPPGTGAAPAGAERCDPIDPSYCLFPFPNNYFTTADGQTDTRMRVNLNLLAMPKNILGKPIDPTDWNRNDGFSPGQPILTRVPGLDLQKTGAVPITNIEASLQREQPIVLIDALTLKKQLIWAEMDANLTAGALAL